MDKIIIYGAGNRGQSYFGFLKYKKLDYIVEAFCDRNASVLNGKLGLPVITYEEAKMKGLPFLIGVSTDFANEIESALKKDGQLYYDDFFDMCNECLKLDKVKLNRDYCAYYHVDYMDDYFREAESENSLNSFWTEDGKFYPLFMRLDLTNVIELACGRGRHVPKYLAESGHVTLIDVLEKNISFVRERFKGYDNISYYKNNGSDFAELPNETYTALFTYDAMVHFELLDVAKYLQETYRVLKNGGMALFHHSNNHYDYKASFSNSPGGRSFMSKEIFAYLAYRSGFEIIEQTVIDWGEQDLDCLSLVKKVSLC